MRIREDLSLTFAALRSLNGANIHKVTGLIAAYQQAVEVAANPRTPKAIMPAAVAHVARCEAALRGMVGGVTDDGLYAKNAREQLRRWDAGDSIWSIEMGGLGPGYEQAIQVLAIEIVRDEIDKPLPTDNPQEWGDATVSRIDYQLPDGSYSCGGFSGAQVGAAKQLAYHWLRDGPAKSLGEVPKDRHIQASKRWPHAPCPRGHRMIDRDKDGGRPLPDTSERACERSMETWRRITEDLKAARPSNTPLPILGHTEPS